MENHLHLYVLNCETISGRKIRVQNESGGKMLAEMSAWHIEYIMEIYMQNYNSMREFADEYFHIAVMKFHLSTLSLCTNEYEFNFSWNFPKINADFMMSFDIVIWNNQGSFLFMLPAFQFTCEKHQMFLINMSRNLINADR
jgi:hypothetical protein